MICYRLHCPAGHEFEGWFPSGKAYDRQRETGLVSCPRCESTEIEKSLMAPAVSRTVDIERITPADQLRMALHAVRKEVEAQCDNVGDRFAVEALKRHNGQDQGERRSERGIYGTMSSSERKRLEDEGVDFTPIPWIDHSDS
ncbi:DUF1178 family protein [Asaia prunellae]|uniref:DUF1178 family protein n=1 Tax=Asaia prunellae TaxID=610245 RepID=UPI000470E778|nr:DUF1178 family protein [Asaia prunellae]